MPRFSEDVRRMLGCLCTLGRWVVTSSLVDYDQVSKQLCFQSFRAPSRGKTIMPFLPFPGFPPYRRDCAPLALPNLNRELHLFVPVIYPSPQATR